MYIPVAVLVLIIFSSAGIGFGVAILMAMAGRQSREEHWRKLYKNQEDRWMQYLDKIYRLYNELIIVLERGDTSISAVAYVATLRTKIMNLFDETQIVITVYKPNAK